MHCSIQERISRPLEDLSAASLHLFLPYIKKEGAHDQAHHAIQKAAGRAQQLRHRNPGNHAFSWWGNRKSFTMSPFVSTCNICLLSTILQNSDEVRTEKRIHANQFFHFSTHHHHANIPERGSYLLYVQHPKP
jgi:hypothetical protein